MSLFAIILAALAVVSVGLIYFAIKTAERQDEELTTSSLPKFEPRKVTVVVSEGTEKPKRRYKKRNKKKKPAVTENTIVEKRPVGRPKISK
jgi:hypothetical protein